MAATAVDIYNQALANNTAIYNQVASGYNQVIQQQQAARQQIYQGYNQLSSTVQGTIGGIGRAAAQQIADQYTALSGQEAQNLTNRGLGNTTVASSVNRGIALDKSKADVELQDRIAQTQAQYLSSIGLAGLGYAGQSQESVGALGASKYNTLAGFQGSFANLYGGLAQAQQYQSDLAYNRSQQAIDRIFAGEQAAAQRSQASRAMAGAESQQAQKMGLAAQGLQAERQNAANRLNFGYAQLGQQQQQFDQNLNYRYDLAGGTYGVGAPSQYIGPTYNPLVSRSGGGGGYVGGGGKQASSGSRR